VLKDAQCQGNRQNIQKAIARTDIQNGKKTPGVEFVSEASHIVRKCLAHQFIGCQFAQTFVEVQPGLGSILNLLKLRLYLDRCLPEGSHTRNPQTHR
jgi:CobQ-like glutamine amidotransferase family enzyme